MWRSWKYGYEIPTVISLNKSVPKKGKKETESLAGRVWSGGDNAGLRTPFRCRALGRMLMSDDESPANKNTEQTREAPAPFVNRVIPRHSSI
jgi:hypothetical protein